MYYKSDDKRLKKKQLYIQKRK